MSQRAASVPAAVPAAGPRLYHGWVMVGALGVTQTVGYGVLVYAFPVFLAPMEAEFGWTRTQLTGAFSLAALVAGGAAVPIGRYVDRHGARAVMTAGSVLAALLLVGWARVGDLWSYYALWLGLGLASAAVLYEPAFALLANWFVRRRAHALTVLTFLGGFASVLFVPLATALVEAHGWRSALLWLAALLALLTVPAHALLLRRFPEDHGLLPDGDAPGPHSGAPRPASAPPTTAGSVATRVALGGRSFRLLAVAFGLSALVTTAVAVHLIPLLLERGHGAAFAGGALAAVGVAALPGRLVFTPLGGRWSMAGAAALIFLLQAVALAVLAAGSGTVAVWIFVVLFGAGFGAITPARAALLAEFYGRVSYAAISGTLVLVLCLARAAAPVGASVAHDAAGGYTAVLLGACVASLVAAGAVLGAAPGRSGAARAGSGRGACGGRSAEAV